ncbi:efflux RND transporter periplasmic adaptor subunit [bacterium SCSIO 12827]|nr:efflux RND transporter periplasmic adaptor subunit [bacterium SCSIO 12827]
MAEGVTAGRVLYWKHPDGQPEYSAEPKKSADGRDFIPVHDDEEPDFVEAGPKAPPMAAEGGPKKILYYRNPMGLPDTSPVPKKDWMGMDYIPVYEGEEDSGATVKVSLAKVQTSGVRSAPVELRRLVRPVRAPAVAKHDERTLYSVVLRADSFIEALYVNETGRHIKKGEPLFRVYSPEMVRVQVDYRSSALSSGRRDEKGALQRLENLQIPPKVIAALRKSGDPVMSIDWPSPVSGVAMAKKAVNGMMMKAGDEAMRIAGLDPVWVIADIAEQDIGHVREGDRARVTFRALPGQVYEGRVTFILHELDMATRTGKVRIEVANPEHRILHEMFAEAEIETGGDRHERLTVPRSALIDSGNRQVVILDLGEGRFEPRPVKIGLRADDYVEITEGVAAGDQVVVAATFLIDAESNLKAALSGFTADAPAPDKATEPASPAENKP